MPSIKYILRKRLVTFALTFCLCLSTFVLLLKIAQKYDPLSLEEEENEVHKLHETQPSHFKRKNLHFLQTPSPQPFPLKKHNNNNNKKLPPEPPKRQLAKPPSSHPSKSKSKPENSNKTFSKADLDQASRFTISKACDDAGFGADLLVVVHSPPENVHFREAIRSTWGQQFKENGVLIYFLVGSTSDQLLQKKLKTEDSASEDLIQTAAPDQATLLKSLAMLKFSSERCPRARYLLKLPDTVFVNAGNVTEYCERTWNNGRTILGGDLKTKLKTPKNIHNRYRLPGYSAPLLPDFFSGPVYLMSGEVAKLLLQVVKAEKSDGFTNAEDLLITGILAEKAKVKRKYLKQLTVLTENNTTEHKVKNQTTSTNNHQCSMLSSWIVPVKDEAEMTKLWTDRWEHCDGNRK